jgi:membrane protein YqaA with SNARE-associated domain
MKTESAGLSRTEMFVWSTILHWEDMSILLTLLVTAVGTFAGNLTLFWLIGKQAQRAERQQRKEAEKLQRAMEEAMAERYQQLRNYAIMES